MPTVLVKYLYYSLKDLHCSAGLISDANAELIGTFSKSGFENDLFFFISLHDASSSFDLAKQFVILTCLYKYCPKKSVCSQTRLCVLPWVPTWPHFSVSACE